MKRFGVKMAVLTLLFSMLAGIAVPLSPVQAGTYYSPAASEIMAHQLDYVYSKLDAAEKQAIDSARANLLALDDPGNMAANVSLIDEVWDGVQARIDENAQLAAALRKDTSAITKENMLKVLAFLGSVYYPDGSQNQPTDVPTDMKPILRQLADLAGVSFSGMGWDNASSFMFYIENAVWSQIPYTFAEWAEFAADPQGWVDQALLGIRSILSTGQEGSMINNMFEYYTISSTDFEAVMKRMMNQVDPDHEAGIALMLGYIRTNAYLDNPDVISPDGKTHDYYTMYLMGMRDIPVALFTWTSSDANIAVTTKVDDDSKVPYMEAKLLSGDYGTTVLEAKLNLGSTHPLNGKAIFRGKITIGKHTELVTDQMVYSQGHYVHVTYMLHGFTTSEGVNQAEFVLNYDPAVFELVNQTYDIYKGIFNPFGTFTHSAAEGKIIYSLSYPSNLPIWNGDPVFGVFLRVKEHAQAGTSTLTLGAPTMVNTNNASYTVEATSVSITVEPPPAEAMLTELSLNTGPLEFAHDTLEYTIDVRADTAAIDVTAYGSGSITVNGIAAASGSASHLHLKPGANFIAIAAAETGKISRTYTLTVIREMPFSIGDVSLNTSTPDVISASTTITPATQSGGQAVVVFKLMKGNTPMRIIQVQETITSAKTYTADFNGYSGSGYWVKVMVLDALDNTTSSVGFVQAVPKGPSPSQ